MNWNKANAVSGVGTFILTLLVVALMIWPSPWFSPSKVTSNLPVVSHIPVSVWLLVCVLLVSAGMQITAAIVSYRTASVPPHVRPIFTLLDKEPKRDFAAVYISKLYLVFRNDRADRIDLMRVIWEPAGNIGLPPPPQQLLQVEGSGGWQLNNWQPETHVASNVKIGQALRTWIPLNPAAIDTDIRRHVVAQDLGILTIFFNLNGREEKQVIHV